MMDLKKASWYGYFNRDIIELLEQSLLLYEEVKDWKTKFHDYSFVVFPAAKAYEGFLKKIFFDMKLITSEEYFGKRFRIGRALNPELDRNYEHESIYRKISQFCNSYTLAQNMWDTWRECRNLVFHYFPKEKQAISLDQAFMKINMIIESIDFSFKECKIGN